MYRRPRIAWLDPVLRHARARPGPADDRGHAQACALLQALKKGEAIGLLPDQVPAKGHGVMADFSGAPPTRRR
jgi:KDO2-lipid IV(A) lauroyltransferase